MHGFGSGARCTEAVIYFEQEIQRGLLTAHTRLGEIEDPQESDEEEVEDDGTSSDEAEFLTPATSPDWYQPRRQERYASQYVPK